eukprot:CAMPEP_0183607648 /NCGR_PEP_ID=MMETSP0371-20130417/183562_1 /TAXON_ID=268820 /ORGANISM="Peridinium aciculiferum, Strain PAER-2" /LENGTH=436 /DNA_ID=CAMNT_0025819771 /DNA_START=74 /DNA_END=1386 /DNA_ORIENTATION=-
MDSTLTMERRSSHLGTVAECKEHTEGLIGALQKDIDALVGKEHYKERAANGKAITELRAKERYIDACRVSRGLAPAHGFFTSEAPTSSGGGTVSAEEAAKVAEEVAQKHAEAPTSSGGGTVSAEEAAKVAEEVAQKLAELQSPHAEEGTALPPGPGDLGGRPEDAEELVRGWERRVAVLEAKVSKPHTLPAENTKDKAELEDIAKGIVWYRDRLRVKCGYSHGDLNEDKDLQGLEARLDGLAKFLLGEGGYSNRDLNDDRDLQSLEARLDGLAKFLLPEEEEKPKDSLEVEADRLRQWAQSLMAQLSQPNPSTSGLNPSGTKEAERLTTEIAELKADLAAQGLTEREQDKEERVLLKLVRLAELKQWDHRDKKHDNKEALLHKGIQGEVQQLRAKIEEHKHRLRDELGFTQKEVKQDSVMLELDERLTSLCKMVGA